MFRIQSINAKGCRGIKDGPKLTIEEGGLILCGDNGTGKSSFIDVIDKVLSTKCSSLDIGDQGVSWNKQGTHIAVSNAEAELVVTDGTEEAAINLDTKRPKMSAKVKLLLDAAEQNTFILRRRTLLDFIDAKPAERYNQAEGFVKLEKYPELEDGIKGLVSAAKKGAQTETTKLEIEEHTLQAIFSKHIDIHDDAAVIAEINGILHALITPIEAFDQIPARILEVASKIAALGDLEAIIALQTLKEQLRKFPEEKSLQDDMVEFEKTIKSLHAEESLLKGKFYHELLEMGTKWITEDQMHSCPLCEQKIDPAKVQERILQRLATNEELLKTRKRCEQSKTLLARKVKGYVDDLEPIMGNKKLEPSRVQQLQIHKTRLEKMHAAISSLNLPELNNVLTLSMKGELDLLMNELRTETQQASDAVPEGQNYAKLADAKAKLITFVEKKTSIFEHEQRKAIYERNHELLEIIRSHAETARKKAIQDLLNTVAKQADTYFQAIHPGESIGEPELEVTDRGQGSIVLKSKFYNNEKGDPRGNYSEGHVDSLGLCLFLAIRRLHYSQRPELAILVLDDVLHSVDGQHRQTTAELIFNEFKDHQIIITTHDPLWFENLKTAAKTLAPDKKYTLKRIAEWSITEGPIWGDHMSEYEWLMSVEGTRAKPADRIIKAGRLLEEMLQNLCDRLTVSTPFKIDGKYTIDPLWASFREHVKGKKGFMLAAGGSVTKIESLRSLRNLAGAHWNLAAAGLTNDESKAFTEAIISLRQLAYCDACGKFIARIPEIADLWSCSGRHIQYDNGKVASVTHPFWKPTTPSNV